MQVYVVHIPIFGDDYSITHQVLEPEPSCRPPNDPATFVLALNFVQHTIGTLVTLQA